MPQQAGRRVRQCLGQRVLRLGVFFQDRLRLLQELVGFLELGLPQRDDGKVAEDASYFRVVLAKLPCASLPHAIQQLAGLVELVAFEEQQGERFQGSGHLQIVRLFAAILKGDGAAEIALGLVIAAQGLRQPTQPGKRRGEHRIRRPQDRFLLAQDLLIRSLNFSFGRFDVTLVSVPEWNVDSRAGKTHRPNSFVRILELLKAI